MDNSIEVREFNWRFKTLNFSSEENSLIKKCLVEIDLENLKTDIQIKLNKTKKDLIKKSEDKDSYDLDKVNPVQFEINFSDLLKKISNSEPISKYNVDECLFINQLLVFAKESGVIPYDNTYINILLKLFLNDFFPDEESKSDEKEQKDYNLKND